MTSSHQTIEIAQVIDFITAPPVVYFCAEYALNSNLPIYAGGLGILAGDVIGQASEDKRSFIGIGLFYRHGYLHQEISKEANLNEQDDIDPDTAGLKLLVDQGAPVLITLPIHARTVQVKAWVYQAGTVSVLLLDTDVEGNEAQDINICDRLYYGDHEHRFKQEMLLGIGGLRMFQKLGKTPRLFHLNEGHSALMFFELVRQMSQNSDKKNVQEDLEHITNVAFTNHTLVPAGNDVFSKDLVISFLSSFALEFPIDPSILVKFGLIQDTSLFSPTMLALRLATVSQAVSELHAKKALEIWPDHPLIPVTNGVRKSFWQSPEISSHETSDDSTLWKSHIERKKKLRSLIQDVTGFAWAESDLILGWSRRLANYKRPLLLFEDKDRLQKILTQSSVPVRVLFSGKPHAHDEAANENLRRILEYVGSYGGSIVYLQNYSIDVAKFLLSGIDVLLNTPVRGYEACGTSGMKASLNGVLLATTLDGWTDEVKWDGVGWVINDEDSANSLYDIIEKQIIPLYVDRDSSGVPRQWVERMRKSIQIADERFTAKHMLEQLEAKIYSQIKPLEL